MLKAEKKGKSKKMVKMMKAKIDLTLTS